MVNSKPIKSGSIIYKMSSMCSICVYVCTYAISHPLTSMLFTLAYVICHIIWCSNCMQIMTLHLIKHASTTCVFIASTYSSSIQILFHWHNVKCEFSKVFSQRCMFCVHVHGTLNRLRHLTVLPQWQFSQQVECMLETYILDPLSCKINVVGNKNFYEMVWSRDSTRPTAKPTSWEIAFVWHSHRVLFVFNKCHSRYGQNPSNKHSHIKWILFHIRHEQNALNKHRNIH